MNLSKVSTKQLIKELGRRDGVMVEVLEVGETTNLTYWGPMTIVTISTEEE